MFALVLWKNSRQISTIPLEDVSEGKGKWGKSWYSCKVLKKSGKFFSFISLFIFLFIYSFLLKEKLKY